MLSVVSWYLRRHHSAPEPRPAARPYVATVSAPSSSEIATSSE